MPRGFLVLSMWRSMLQVSLCLRTSHCFDFLSEWKHWLQQSGDNVELLQCMHVLPSLLKIFLSLIGRNLLLGVILRTIRPPSTLVGMSASPQSMLSNPALFRARLVWTNSPSFRICAWSAMLHSRSSSSSDFSFAFSTAAFLVCWIGNSKRLPSAVDLSLYAGQALCKGHALA